MGRPRITSCGKLRQRCLRGHFDRLVPGWQTEADRVPCDVLNYRFSPAGADKPPATGDGRDETIRLQ